MRRFAGSLTAAFVLAAARLAFAADPVEDETAFAERFVLDTGRFEYKPPDPNGLSFSIHGEYQLRYRGMSDLRLEAPIGRPDVTTLGQNQYLYHYLRVGARFGVFDKIAIVMQIDAPRGLIVGDKAQAVSASRDALDKALWYEVHPRYLYLEYDSPIGLFRLGQQGWHWGMGLVANDGDHPSLFGDYRRGSLVERVFYEVTPFGKGTPFAIQAAGDLVFQDPTADLLSGDRAFQAVAALVYRPRGAELGVYGAARRQDRNARAVDQYTPFVESLTSFTVDLAGRFEVPLPDAHGFAYGRAEAATIFGSTSFVRSTYDASIDPTAPHTDERILAFGGAAVLGAVKVAGDGKDRYGRVAGEIELGYASGDAQPNDGVSRRFTFDENHHVGLVLFDHVLRWKTARAATNAQDPSLVARAPPGIELLPTNGGVAGAQYVNARVVVRPKRWLDLEGGALVAQATADVVDPYSFGVLGNARNYDGGDPRAHDLGVELDAGVRARIELDPGSILQVGAQGGVLFPGHAFDDAAGRRLANPWLGTLEVGLQF